MRDLLVALTVLTPSLAAAQLLPIAPPEQCVSAVQNQVASSWLERSAATVLPASLDGRVVRYRMSQDTPL